MPRPRPVVAPVDPPPPAADDVWADGGMKVVEAVRFSSLCRETLYELMRAGRLAWRKPGKNRVIARRSLVRHLAGHPSGGG